LTYMATLKMEDNVFLRNVDWFSPD
jgi:hypothetical protein